MARSRITAETEVRSDGGPPGVHTASTLDPKRLRGKLGEIERAALSGASTDDLLALIWPIAQGYITHTSSIEGPFFRGRPNARHGRFSTIRDIWYPPATSIPQGRVNEAGKSVFYCSASHQTVTRELNPSQGDGITILHCKLKVPGDMPHVFSIGAVKRIIRTGTNLFSKRVELAFDFRRYPPQMRKNALMMDSFLSRVFTAEDRAYFNLTNAVARFYMDSKEIDGLVYPSARPGGSWNLALKPEAADKFLAPESVFSVRLEKKLDGNRLFMRCDGTATVNSAGLLVWNR